jgi:hypothetical protein
MDNKMIKAGIFYFFTVVIVGFILRWKAISPIIPDIQYMHLVHAHSHVAFLGWVYFILVALILRIAIPKNLWEQIPMRIFWILIHLSVIGMLISFSMQGYGMFSIFFSTAHILLSYWFAYYYYRNNRKDVPIIVHRFILIGFLCNIISSFGPWALAVVGAMGLGDTPLPNLFVYLYLHFQYNGWFTFIIMGAVYSLLLQNKRDLPMKAVSVQLTLLAVSIIPSYIPSILWFDLPSAIELMGMAGAILQWVSVILFLKIVWVQLLNQVQAHWLKWLLNFSFLCLGLKATLELVGAVPSVAALIYLNRQVIIGYLHLSLLGFVSTFLLYYILQSSTHVNRIGSFVTFLYIVGTMGMIIILLSGGLLQWIGFTLNMWYWEGLWVTSLLILLSVPGIIHMIYKGAYPFSRG